MGEGLFKMIESEAIPPTEKQERVEALVAKATGYIERLYDPYLRDPRLKISNNDDDADLEYLIDEASQLKLEAHYSAGGYAGRFGVNRWVTITAPEHERTTIQSSYSHPQTFSYTVFTDTTSEPSNQEIDQALEYAEHVISIFEMDMARRSLARQRGKTIDSLYSGRPQASLEVSELTYFMHQE